MNSFAQQKNQSNNKKSAQGNPFARALAETEQAAYGSANPYDKNNKGAGSDFLSDAFAKTGSSLPDTFDKFPQNNNYEKQQKELLKNQKKERLRKQLHEKVNPVEQVKIFSSREKQVKKEIDKLREELKFLAMDVKKFTKEIDITLMTEVANPGQSGTYYINFFQKLRAFIMLLRKKIKSARTWARQNAHVQSKKKKAKKKKRGGLNFAGNEAKAVHDTMHHERSSMYTGN